MNSFSHIKKEELNNKSKTELLYELIMWDNDTYNVDLGLICQQLIGLKNLKMKLFIIAFSQSNILLSTFKEKDYIFDEDIHEVKRQIRLGLYTHLFILIFVIGITFAVVNGINLWTGVLIGAVLLISYAIMALKDALKLFTPASKRIKTSTNNTYT